ncbi:hypothetical protein [Paenibacillus protaetiae]|uniref:Uncharacterized protein n=1 Tax=Paenibacillus protaetiae TaxID=2509456 RepID=A0A4P6F188_9BACL|nr:hypothetical protein [Paenibacillus protaetiae]QAY66787.1 hypothetical protein ET464_10570 [Paenibacillus protaetiae]
MIPFERTWPYDIIMNDIYAPSCPFCGQDNVLLPIRPEEIEDIHHGKKKLLVFPCCHSRITVVDMDSDYILAAQRLRAKV